MKSFEDRFYLQDAGFLRRAARDVLLFCYLASKVLLWVVLGRRVRKAYRRAERSGAPLAVDELHKGRV